MPGGQGKRSECVRPKLTKAVRTAEGGGYKGPGELYQITLTINMYKTQILDALLYLQLVVS